MSDQRNTISQISSHYGGGSSPAVKRMWVVITMTYGVLSAIFTYEITSIGIITGK